MNSFGDPTTALSNDSSIGTGMLVSVLDVTDPRYDVFCYGPFMKDLPRRMGHSQVLDASASAFASAVRAIRTKQTSVDALQKYGVALSAIQQSLGDSTTAYSADTLCSVYLIMVCHEWLATKGDAHPKHGEGMAQILKRLVEIPSPDSFTAGVICTVSMVVVRHCHAHFWESSSGRQVTNMHFQILEAVFNPNIELYPWITKVSPMDRTDPKDQQKAEELGLNFRSISYKYLARVPSILRNSKDNLTDVHEIYETIRIDYPGVRDFAENVIEPACSAAPYTALPLKLVQAQTQIHASMCLMLTVAIVFNLLLRHYDSGDERLFWEYHGFVADAITLAERAKARRPFAASHIPLSLLSAWYAADDPEQRRQLHELLNEYHEDYITIGLVRNAINAQLGDRIKLLSVFDSPEPPYSIGSGSGSGTGSQDAYSSAGELADDAPLEASQAAELCCIL